MEGCRLMAKLKDFLFSNYNIIMKAGTHPPAPPYIALPDKSTRASIIMRIETYYRYITVKAGHPILR
eukprot:scaffold82038_cov74-Attheya_sp.AAC.1